jgi:hypothetical protein
MNVTEHILTTAGEECSEVHQRISKALRFGLDQIQQDADDKPEENPLRLDNRARIRQELGDLLGMLHLAGIFDLYTEIAIGDIRGAGFRKIEKFKRYLDRSRNAGTLSLSTEEALAMPCEFGCGRTIDECMSANCPSRYETKIRSLEGKKP